MRKIVIIGAGRLGKGFIGETFSQAGWDITFIDKDKKVIDKLLEKNEYTVTVHRMEQIDTHTITGYSAFTWEDEEADKRIATADLIMMPIYPEDFHEAFKNMEKGLFIRYKNTPEHTLSIICLTNKNHLMKDFENEMRRNKDDEYIRWLNEYVALRDSIIRRSTDADDTYSLQIRSTAVLSLLIQKPLHVSLSDVEWMELTDNLELLKDLKVFAVNGPHVTSAFAGYYYGYEIWNEAIKNQKVKDLMDKVSDEITNTILKAYPITKQQLHNLSFFPIAKGEMEDTIYRIAKDPIRKLSNNDRLVGIAKIAEENQLSIDGLSEAIALGYLYDNHEDEAAMKIQNCISKKGIAAAIQDISGIDDTSKLYEKVLHSYNLFKLLQNR